MTDIAIKEFFDPRTSTLTYVVYDPESRDAVIIDPVLDYDGDGQTVAPENLLQESFERLVEFLKHDHLRPHFILETHAHADHLSASQLLKAEYPDAVLAIGERIKEVQTVFKKELGEETIAVTDGSQFDRLLKAGEAVRAGTLEFTVIPTPGHTPACVTYHFKSKDGLGALFTGDAIFMPDSGTGRCDFPGGSAEALYDSITQNLYTLPEETPIYVGHDYQPGGRELRFKTTVGEQKAENIHLKSATTKAEYVQFRTTRDKTLKPPRLIIPSLKVNLAGGRFRR